MGVFRWWVGALTVRVEGRGVCGGWRSEGSEFSLSEWENSSSSLKFMGMRRGAFLDEVVVAVFCAGGVVVVLFWGESWAIGVLEWLRIGV